jgi:hypothetical protein
MVVFLLLVPVIYRNRRQTADTIQKHYNTAKNNLIAYRNNRNNLNDENFNSNQIGTMSTTDSPANPRILALFDVDGTLTIPRGEITEDMMLFMKELSTKICVGIVGGTFRGAFYELKSHRLN